jgi:hypothetical protein
VNLAVASIVIGYAALLWTAGWWALPVMALHIAVMVAFMWRRK